MINYKVYNLLFHAVHRYIKNTKTTIHNGAYGMRAERWFAIPTLSQLLFFHSPLFSFSSLSFFFFFFYSFFVGIFVTYTCFVHAQRAKSGLHADVLQKFHRHRDDAVLPLC